MASKKPAASKRAPLPRRCDFSRAFRKDGERFSRSGRYDMTPLKEAMIKLVAHAAPLGPEWMVHPLRGEWADYRECHIGVDFHLMYQVDEDAVVFVRAGSHADRFDE